MESEQETVVRSYLKCYAAGDRTGVLNHCADDAILHSPSWRDPYVGRDSIRAELDRQFDGMSNHRSEIRNILSKDGVVVIELIETFTSRGKEVTVHSSGVFEIDSEGKIARERDYWDAGEIEAQFT
jgi:limonene-1,2-epoxide hydrolase